MIINIIGIALGFGLLMLGAQWLVDGASSVARKYHIPEMIIGLTIVSIGTSMPELVVSLTSALGGHSDISIGNVLGSNLCNLLLILGITSVIFPLVFEKSSKKIDIPIMLISTIIFFILANINNGISRIDGGILSIAFICFIIYTIKSAKKSISNAEKEENDPNISNAKPAKTYISILKIIAGIILLKVGRRYKCR